MNMPRENDESPGRADDRLIDRLVDGELPDVERRQLLLRLETEPDGWRRCALAFLEAQTWREALGTIAAPAGAAIRPADFGAMKSKKSNVWRPAARLAALAAGLAAAFALGRAWHGGSVPNAPGTPVAKRETPAEPAPPEPVDVASGEARPAGPGEPNALIDPVVKRWEQKGYRAERQKRVVSVELKDGRKLSVPINEVRLQYVGDRTY